MKKSPSRPGKGVNPLRKKISEAIHRPQPITTPPPEPIPVTSGATTDRDPITPSILVLPPISHIGHLQSKSLSSPKITSAPLRTKAVSISGKFRRASKGKLMSKTDSSKKLYRSTKAFLPPTEPSGNLLLSQTEFPLDTIKESLPASFLKAKTRLERLEKYSTVTDLKQKDKVLIKVKEDPRYSLILVITLDENNDNDLLLLNLLDYIRKEKLNVAVLEVNYIDILYIIRDLSFLKNSELNNAGRLDILIISQSGISTEVTNKLQKITEVLSPFNNSPLVIYSPRAHPVSEWPDCYIWNETEEKQSKGRTQDKMKMKVLIRRCTKATILILSENNLGLDSHLSKLGINTINITCLEDSNKVLSKMPSLKTNPFFRIIISTDKPEEEMVYFLRNKGIMGPILFYMPNSTLDSIIPEHFYNHTRIQATPEFVELVRYASMTPLTWAPTLTGGFMSSNWEGVITVHEILGRGLISSSNKTNDPFIVAYMGESKKLKTKKILKTHNPHWEDLGWKFSECSAMDTFTFEIWDWDLIGHDSYIGEVKFSIVSVLSTVPKSDNVFLSKNYLVTNKKNDKHKVSGILNITLQFSAGTEQNKISKHFGKPLIESIEIAKKDGMTHLTEDLIMLLMEIGTTSEGIIRIPGNKPTILALKTKLDAGQEITEGDPYDLASVLKLYLSELPDSLIPESVYLKVAEMNFESPDTVPVLGRILRSELPKHNWNLLELCCKFFCEVCNNTEQTKMLPSNIGISIGPTLCLSQKLRDDTTALIVEVKHAAALLACIVTNAKTIFNWKL